jgi:rhodanese-related sulfurtransferase
MVKDISRDEFRRALDNSEIEYLFDARSDSDYEKEHILGAEHLTPTRVEQGIGLPHRKDARIVFYCGSEECPASGKAARAAVAHGYTNVSRFRGGIAEWVENHLPVERDVHTV